MPLLASPRSARRLHGYLPLLAILLVALLSGCVSTRYKPADKRTPPADVVNLPLAQTPVEVTLVSIITYNGPGSWKRDAFWDEYVFTLRNPNPDIPVVITDAELEDITNTKLHAGIDPWALERTSKTHEERMRDAGVAFVRYTAPFVTIMGIGGLAVVGSGIFTSTSVAVANATVVAIPVYYLGVIVINANNRAKMEQEFNRRRIALPLTLAPGASRTGSLFFPMAAGPRVLRLQTSAGMMPMPLRFLRTLHLDPAKVRPEPEVPAAPKTDPSLDP